MEKHVHECLWKPEDAGVIPQELPTLFGAAGSFTGLSLTKEDMLAAQ